MAIGQGDPTARLTEEQARQIVEQGIPASLVEGKRVLVLTPDATRTAPLPLMVRLINDWIGPRAKALDFMVALGTHQPMSDEKLFALFGLTPADREGPFARCRFLNHRWDRPDTLKKIGTLPASSVASITGGLFSEDVDVVINRAIYDYDLLLILGPVFPHEVVGILGRQQVPLPRHLGRRLRALLPLAGRGHHLRKHHRVQAHPRARGRGEGRGAGQRAPALPRHGRRRRRAWRASGPARPRGLGGRGRPLRPHAHRVQAAAVPHRAGPRARDVRRGVDGGQGDVQARARGGRRRPAHHLGAPHQGDLAHLGNPPRAHRLPRARLLPEADGPVRRRAARRARPLHARARRGHLRERGGEAPHRGGARHRHPRVDVPPGQPRVPRPRYDPGGDYAGREDEGVLFVDHAGEVLHRLESERERNA